ncbi:MAG: L-threonylcarbamoyladenylate synthase, partial [Pyrinomonadaceae bacterium]
TESGAKFIHNFFPGPLTIILRKSERVPVMATAGLDTIGIRMPRFRLTQQFLTFCGMPIVAPSANLSGRPSPTTWESVFEDLDGRIDCILQSDATEIGLESTVVDSTSTIPQVLRSGSISLEQLRNIIPETDIHQNVRGEAPRSPGMRHRHYSPYAKVVVVKNTSDITFKSRTAYIGVNQPTFKFEVEKLCSGIEDYAHSIFEFFRECDRLSVATIYCEGVEEIGIGVAIMDRIRRAADK